MGNEYASDGTGLRKASTLLSQQRVGKQESYGSTATVGAEATSVLANSSGGVITLTLPQEMLSTGREVTIIDIVERPERIVSPSRPSANINGSANYEITSDRGRVQLLSDGNAWYVAN